MIHFPATARYRRAIAIALVYIAFSTIVLLWNPPEVFADTFGNTSTAGMGTYPAAGYLLYARFTAASSGTLTQVSFFASLSGSANGNAGIYADSSGSPGSIMAQGTAAALVNGQNDFSISGSVSITSGTSYWLAFEMSASSFYYSLSSSYVRGYATGATCCTLPSTISGGVKTTGSYAIFATYSTGPPPSDFTITANTPSQTVGAGATATYTLTITYSSTLTATVNLAVTSGCPAGVTCTLSPSSVTGSNTVTLSVPTLITTPGGTTTITVTASSASPALSHSVSVQLTVNSPGSYSVNVHAGATQVIVTISWTGSGTASVTLAGPGGSPTLSESGAVVYDRVTYVSGSSSPTNIHRATFTITAPTSAQTWTVLVSLSGSYTVTIEVS